MEHGPERDEDEQGEGEASSRPDRPGPSTGGVRIIGAETAAEITSELPIVAPASIDPNAATHESVRFVDDPGAPSPDPSPTDAVHTELPHWTEPATGQVPAVLSRGDDGGTDGGILPPTWREEDADWTAHEEEFEPSMFGGKETSLGALDETDDADEERRPWEFDLDSVRPGQPSPASSHADRITEPVDLVPADVSDPASRPEGHRSPPAAPEFAGPATKVVGAAEVAAAAHSDAPIDDAGVGEGDSDASEGGNEAAASGATRPSGETRRGRVRRGGLDAARIQAKRPDDAGDLAEPLAAEPPGASVADVPGAGRRRSGLASLAAADRLAVQEQERMATESSTSPGTDEPSGSKTVRRGRRSTATTDRPPRSSSNYTPEVTGGGPPAPAAASRTAPVSEEGGGGTGVRVGTGIAVAVIALLAFKTGTVAALVLCVVIVTFAAGETFAVLRRSGWRPATLLGLAGTVALMVGAYDKGVAALPVVLVLVTVFTLLWYVFGVERGSAVAGTASTLLVVGWVALLGSFAGLLLSPSLFPHRHGIAFLLGAVIATAANDIGALVVGRWIGNHQLAKNISPNKTWEGLVGGTVTTILVSTVAVGAIHPWTAANAAVLGIVVSVVAPLGDLCESLLKRDLRLKDMGTLLPGHGGVLDRVDALIFVLPATYYLVRALNIG